MNYLVNTTNQPTSHLPTHPTTHQKTNPPTTQATTHPNNKQSSINKQTCQEADNQNNMQKGRTDRQTDSEDLGTLR